MSNPPATHSAGGANRPELLVSVQSIEEFELVATIGDIDIIDLKDPSRGALSPTSTELWNQVAERSSQKKLQQSLSAALGEFEQADQCVGDLPPEFSFSKMGSSDCEDACLLQQRWRSIEDRLPESTEFVAVAYADFTSAKSICPADVLRCAIGSGLNRILIDTFNKEGRTSIDHFGIQALRQFADTARANGVWWSLAGSIDHHQIDQLVSAGIHPDCIGVRGAVCEGGREQALSVEKCWRFLKAMAVEAWACD